MIDKTTLRVYGFIICCLECRNHNLTLQQSFAAMGFLSLIGAMVEVYLWRKGNKMSVVDPFKLVVGETPANAERMLRDIGWEFDSVRIWESDMQAGDYAYHPDRLNLDVREGLVTSAWVG